jgi:hypothetical protein
MFMLLPLTLSLLFAVLSVNREGMAYPLLSGVAGGIAFWTRQTALFPLVFCVLYLILVRSSSGQGDENHEMKNAFVALALWLSGALVVSGSIMGFFFLKGVFDEFIYWSFAHSMLYEKTVESAVKLDILTDRMASLMRGDFVLIAAGVVLGIANSVRRRREGLFALVFLFFSFLSVLPGHFYMHYFAQLAPALALAAGLGVASVLECLRGRTAKRGVALSFAVLAVLVPVLANSGYYFKYSSVKISREWSWPNPFPEAAAVADYVEKNTEPDDIVYVFGSEPEILFYAEGKSPPPHIMGYPLLTSFPRHREFQRDAWADISASPPMYIIFSNVNTSLLWDRKADLWIYDKLREMVMRDYVLEGVMEVGNLGGLNLQATLEDEMENESNMSIYRRKVGLETR